MDSLASAIDKVEGVSLMRSRLHELPLMRQIKNVLETEVMLAVFGATLAWIPLMQKNSFVIEMHPGPPEGLTLWGSCWTAPPGIFPTKALASWDVNPRSEFGGWARTAHVNHACVARPASTNRRCLRSLRVEAFEVWSFEADVDEIVTLVKDANMARRRNEKGR
ncbi:unnamed protein product [Durusdinium trenchii]|uniref:Uncharacterized protein n=2 Tax=Durusdinium trenchii TaxID=1381693 RepID=A0ABP0HEK7_9DINO